MEFNSHSQDCKGVLSFAKAEGRQPPVGGGGAIAPKGICKSDPLHIYSLGGCQAEEATATGGISSRGMQRLKRPRGTWPCCQSPFCFVSFKGPKQITGENLESKGGDCIGLARKGHSGFSI